MGEQPSQPKTEPNLSPKGDFAAALLLEEYKLIQNKIDKLGEDKFKIRSWSFTLLTGGVAAAKFSGALESSKFGPFLPLVFLPAITAFQLVELRQRQIAKRLGLRAEAIEYAWRRSVHHGTNPLSTPHLAGHMIREGRAEKTRHAARSWWQALLYAKVTRTTRNPADEGNHFRAAPPQSKQGPLAPFWDCLVVNADDVFYRVQYLLVGLFVIILGLIRIWGHTSAPAPTAGDLLLKLNANELRLFVGQTNTIRTNFVEVIQVTTNFQIITQLTTNYLQKNIVVTNPATAVRDK